MVALSRLDVNNLTRACRYKDSVKAGNLTTAERAYRNELPDSSLIKTKIVQQQTAPMNEAEIQQLVFDYKEQQMSVNQLADKYQRHRTTISATLRKNGVIVTSQRMTGEQVEEAKRLYESGLTLRAIGEEFGVSECTVNRTLRRVGVEIRQSHKYTSEERRAIKMPG